jgi:hypothetical protein
MNGRGYTSAGPRASGAFAEDCDDPFARFLWLAESAALDLKALPQLQRAAEEAKAKYDVLSEQKAAPTENEEPPKKPVQDGDRVSQVWDILSWKILCKACSRATTRQLVGGPAPWGVGGPALQQGVGGGREGGRKWASPAAAAHMRHNLIIIGSCCCHCSHASPELLAPSSVYPPTRTHPCVYRFHRCTCTCTRRSA